MLKFVFTCGDINGIGPEIVVKTLNKITLRNPSTKFFFICPSKVLDTTFSFLNPIFDYEIINDIKSKSSHQVTIINSGKVNTKKGFPTVSSGKTAYQALVKSFALLKAGASDAVITAPVSKTALHMAGIKYPGQTEMFARWSKSKNYVMTFLSYKMNAALLTIHEPLRRIPNLLNSKGLKSTLNVILHTLKIDLGIINPRIGILGLNPHAGEGGMIGNEEKKFIQPMIKQFARQFRIEGPFSPDAFFANKLYKNYDLVLGMYHDQILIPFKMINFGKGVNYTAGLPIVRTSPDHGVAYDIADKYIADESSMIQAYKYAHRIVKNRKKKIASG